MVKGLGRLEYLRQKRQLQEASTKELVKATRFQGATTPLKIELGAKSFKGKKAVVIGSGVGGLATAYELLSQTEMEVSVFEAAGRTGGRCLTLRTGDSITEDEDRSLDSKPGTETQVVRFERPVGDAEPYLNAGPGRIPSCHKRVLSYLRKFGVPLEVYVMNSESNLVQLDDKFDGQPMVYRRINHNTRGWLAQLVFENAKKLIEGLDTSLAPEALAIHQEKVNERIKQLEGLMAAFGDLDADGKYEVTAGENGFENGRTRAGYTELPGVAAGKVADPLSFDSLLDSEFWKARFYQPIDFFWQPTMFQPVGGMDQVQHAFAQRVAESGGTIHLNSPVRSIRWDAEAKQFVLEVERVGTDECEEVRADYCFSNVAIPFLKNMLDENLYQEDNQGNLSGGLSDSFLAGLKAVFDAQFKPHDPEKYEELFLACTTKVGWQADRHLWQGSLLGTESDASTSCGVPNSEIGVVPIFGGISWTDDPITQIWYPSNDFPDEKGVLTGAYNFSMEAFKAGKKPVQQRLDDARCGAAKFGTDFANGLEKGVAIAWQRMPHIKGGWADWQTLGAAGVGHFNELVQGSAIDGAQDPQFFIVGDQVSSLPGWQEGAIASALNALARLSDSTAMIPPLPSLPDTRLMVEGI